MLEHEIAERPPYAPIEVRHAGQLTAFDALVDGRICADLLQCRRHHNQRCRERQRRDRHVARRLLHANRGTQQGQHDADLGERCSHGDDQRQQPKEEKQDHKLKIDNLVSHDELCVCAMWAISTMRTPSASSTSISSPRANGTPWHSSNTEFVRTGNCNDTMEPGRRRVSSSSVNVSVPITASNENVRALAGTSSLVISADSLSPSNIGRSTIMYSPEGLRKIRRAPWQSGRRKYSDERSRSSASPRLILRRRRSVSAGPALHTATGTSSRRDR